jgi:hypothetical protein
MNRRFGPKSLTKIETKETWLLIFLLTKPFHSIGNHEWWQRMENGWANVATETKLRK